MTTHKYTHEHETTHSATVVSLALAIRTRNSGPPVSTRTIVQQCVFSSVYVECNTVAGASRDYLEELQDSRERERRGEGAGRASKK